MLQKRNRPTFENMTWK